MTHSVTAIFDTYEAATRAVERVRREGIQDRDISVMSNDTTADRSRYGDYAHESEGASGAATGAGMGAIAGGAAGLLAGAGLLAIPALARWSRPAGWQRRWSALAPARRRVAWSAPWSALASPKTRPMAMPRACAAAARS